jgi:membrane-associated phospholipid phosphatase
MINWCANFTSSAVERIRHDIWLYAAVATYTAVGLILMAVTGHLQLDVYATYARQFANGFLFVMPLVAITFDLAFVRIRFARRQNLAGMRAFSPQRIAHLFAGMMLMMGFSVFQGTFTVIKNLMPALRGGFLYDRTQADVDHWLWFGMQPWKVLYAIAGTPLVLEIVEWNYGLLWFFVTFGALFFAATSPKAETVRTRYFVMFMLVWIVCGNVIASVFISAGPVFYAGVTGNAARFAQQHAFLATSVSEHSTLAYETYLWQLHELGVSGFGSGISAFPSIHVGVAAMNAFFAAEISRRLGAIAFAYAAFVALSSIFLGWHYSVDGLASFLIVAAMHFALRALMKPGTHGRSGTRTVADAVDAVGQPG